MIYVYLWKVKNNSVRLYGVGTTNNKCVVEMRLPLKPANGCGDVEPATHRLSVTASEGNYFLVDEYGHGGLSSNSTDLESILKTYHPMLVFFIRHNVVCYTGWIDHEAFKCVEKNLTYDDTTTTTTSSFLTCTRANDEHSTSKLPTFNVLIYKIYPFITPCLNSWQEIEFVVFFRCQHDEFCRPAPVTEANEWCHLVLMNSGRSAERRKDGRVDGFDQRSDCLLVSCRDEKDLLVRALEIFSDESIHILISYNNACTDDRYLAHRLWKYGLHVTLSEFKYPYQNFDVFYSLHFTPHQMNLDVVQFLKKFMNYKYSNLTDVYLSGLMGEAAVEEWSERVNLTGGRLKLIVDHSERILEVCFRFDLIRSVLTISSACFLSAEQVILAPISRLVEPFVLVEGFRQGFVVRQRNELEGDETFRGGLVLLTNTGLYEKVGIVDFKSYYPSLISALNLSPSTLSSGNASVRTGAVGLWPRLCALLKERRKCASTNPALVKMYKLLNNSIYGLMGSPRSRFYHRPTAEAVAAAGRHHIMLVKELCETKLGLHVVAADTDSLFLSNMEESDQRLAAVARCITNMINLPGLELVEECFFDKIIFVGKKKYFALTSQGDLKVSGIYRRDFSAHSNRTLRGLMTDLLKCETDSDRLVLKYTHELFNFNLVFRHADLSVLANPKIGTRRNIYSDFAKRNMIFLPHKNADVPRSFVWLETSPLPGGDASLALVPELPFHEEDENTHCLCRTPASLVDSLRLTVSVFDQILKAALGRKYACNVFQEVHGTLAKYRFVLYELKIMFLGLAVNFEQSIEMKVPAACVLSGRKMSNHNHLSRVTTITDYLNKQTRFDKRK